MIFFAFELIFFGVLLAGDLLSKYYVGQFLLGKPESNYTYVAIKDVLTFSYSTNNGASLSMLSGKTGLLIGITLAGMIVLFGFICFLHFRKQQRNPKGRFLLCALLMILSGGIGNLVDRLGNNGYVRDFIQYTFLEKIFKTSLFTCNLADVWVSVGVVCLLIYIIFMYKEKKPEVAKEPDDDYTSDNVSEGLKLYEDSKNNKN